MSSTGDELTGVALSLIMWFAWSWSGISEVGELMSVLTGPIWGMTRGEAIILMVILAIVGIWAIIQAMVTILDIITSCTCGIYRYRKDIFRITMSVICGIREFYRGFSKSMEKRDSI